MGIRGIQEAQQANVKMIDAMKPQGALGNMIKVLISQAHRYAVTITHRESGALAASERMEMTELTGRIYIDPDAVNPRGFRPADYGLIEEQRGGTHAFFRRTVEEHVPRVFEEAKNTLFRGMV